MRLWHAVAAATGPIVPVPEFRDSRPYKSDLPKERTMTEVTPKSDWKKAVRESNAIGWIAFLVLVVAIGLGTIMFGGEPISVKEQAAKSANADNPTGLKYLK
jgi:hypothetical protein